MKLYKALKEKNRLAGECVRLFEIILRENSRRNDSTSTVNRNEIYQDYLKNKEKLVKIKSAISKANIGIYSKISRMEEIKSTLKDLDSLYIRSGEEVQLVGRNQEKLIYTWNSFITEEKRDELKVSLQQQINDLQDEVDEYNASTDVDV